MSTPGIQKPVLEILQTLQTQRGHLDAKTITDVARSLHLPAHQIYGVASFYSMLSVEPRHTKVLRMCDGPVCWLCGSDKVRQALNASSHGHPGWAIERTSCLGLCDRARLPW